MKDTFVLTTRYYRQIQRLTMEQRGLLLTAIMMHESGDDLLPEMDGATAMAYDFIAADLDENREKYEEQCRKNAENAAKKATATDRKRPLPTASETQRPLPTASEPERNALDSDSECDSDFENDIEPEKKRENREKKPRFSPPSLDQVAEECKAKGYTFDPEHFISYYESNGWKVGRNPMKDWKAAARNWQSRENKETPKPEKPPDRNKYTPKGDYFNFGQRNYDFAALERQILGGN